MPTVFSRLKLAPWLLACALLAAPMTASAQTAGPWGPSAEAWLAANGGEGWKPVAYSDTGFFSVKMESIGAELPIRQAWTRADTFDSSNFDHAIMLTEFDCGAFRYRDLQVTFHKDGRQIAAKETPGDWYAVEPNTIMRRLVVTVCAHSNGGAT